MVSPTGKISIVISDKNGSLDYNAALGNRAVYSKHVMTIVTDGFNAASQAMDYKMSKQTVDNSSQLDVRMVRNGGFTTIIE